MEAITSGAHDRAPCGVILRDIRNLLANEFLCLDVSLIPRCSNSSAHELASLDLVWDLEHHAYGLVLFL